jgi:hypothetical protein
MTYRPITEQRIDRRQANHGAAGHIRRCSFSYYPRFDSRDSLYMTCRSADCGPFALVLCSRRSRCNSQTSHLADQVCVAGRGGRGRRFFTDGVPGGGLRACSPASDVARIPGPERPRGMDRGCPPRHAVGVQGDASRGRPRPEALRHRNPCISGHRCREPLETMVEVTGSALPGNRSECT